MNDCKICFNKGDGKTMKRSYDGAYSVCNPDKPSPAEDACICPPLGEPKFLPIIAPVIFDECGINLCREIQIPEEIVEAYPTADTIELKVIDIDFNLDDEEGSHIDVIPRRPNCIKVKLARLCVKFVASFLDCRFKLIGQECFEAEYLPNCHSPQYDEETNPSSVTVELYAPYGVSYIAKCGKCKPSINFLGFVEKFDGNNELRQGIGCQCLATVVDMDLPCGRIAVGLSIYLKSIYFVQYKIKHAGQCIDKRQSICR